MVPKPAIVGRAPLLARSVPILPPARMRARRHARAVATDGSRWHQEREEEQHQVQALAYAASTESERGEASSQPPSRSRDSARVRKPRNGSILPKPVFCDEGGGMHTRHDSVAVVARLKTCTSTEVPQTATRRRPRSKSRALPASAMESVHLVAHDTHADLLAGPLANVPDPLADRIADV